MTSTQDEQQVTQVTEADRGAGKAILAMLLEAGPIVDSSNAKAIGYGWLDILAAHRIQTRKEAIEECAKAMDDQWESHWGAYLRNLTNEVE